MTHLHTRNTPRATHHGAADLRSAWREMPLDTTSATAAGSCAGRRVVVLALAAVAWTWIPDAARAATPPLSCRCTPAEVHVKRGLLRGGTAK